jgi:hypothetical protein
MRWRRCGWHGLHCRGGSAAEGTHKTCEGLGYVLDDKRIFGLLGRNSVNHELHGIDAVKEKIQRFSGDGDGSGTEETEHILGLMPHIAYPLEPHHGGGPFERVCRTKKLINNLAIRRILFEGEESRVEVLNVLAGLNQKEFNYTGFVEGACHRVYSTKPSLISSSLVVTSAASCG